MMEDTRAGSMRDKEGFQTMDSVGIDHARHVNNECSGC